MLTLAVLGIAGVGLVCLVLPMLSSGSSRAEITPYGGAAWEDGGTTYRTAGSQRDVLNYYKVQFAERGFYTISLCPVPGERLEDYSTPHPRILYGDRGDFDWNPESGGDPPSGPDLTRGGSVRRTYINPIGDPGGACASGRTDANGDINAQLDVGEINPLSDVWLDYSVEYRQGKGPGGMNLVTVRSDKQDQGRWGR